MRITAVHRIGALPQGCWRKYMIVYRDNCLAWISL